MENKQIICDLLTKTLQATRNHQDLEKIVYNNETEIATLYWQGGGSRDVNVAADSGTAMIRDIMRAID